MFAPYHRARVPGKLLRLALVLALGVALAAAVTLGEAVLIAAVR